MLVLIWLFQSGQVELWHVYAIMAIRSGMQAFQYPAAAASTAMLVPRDWLNRAAGLNQTLGGIMTIAAPALGALALAVLPFHGALLIDVTTALLAVTLLFLYRIPQPQRDTTQRSSLWGDFVDGVRIVVHHRGLLLLYSVVTLLQSQVPNAFQGRVISLLSTVMGLAAPIGLGLVALLGTLIDVREVFIIGGSMAAVICLLGFAAPSLVRIEESPIV